MTKKARFVTAITIIISCSYSMAVLAMGKSPPPSKSERFQQAFVWHDGKQTRTIWLNPNLVAEFNGDPAQSAVRKANPNAREVPQQHGGVVRLWAVDNAEQAISRARGAANGNVSEVFQSSAQGGRKMAAPGNVIVYLNPEWTQGMIDQWAARNRVEIVKKLNIGANIYVIKTGPGLEALEKANALVDSGEVVSAFPDWWQETATR